MILNYSILYPNRGCFPPVSMSTPVHNGSDIQQFLSTSGFDVDLFRIDKVFMIFFFSKLLKLPSAPLLIGGTPRGLSTFASSCVVPY